MHAFDYILLLLSFVYAAAITHILAAAGDIITASRRVRVSWVHAGWMLLVMLRTIVAWFSFWDQRVLTSWHVGTIAFFFIIACGVYLQARLVSPRIPDDGSVDLEQFHRSEGRKYLVAWIVFAAFAIATSLAMGAPRGLATAFGEVLLPALITVVAIPAAVLIANAWVQRGAVLVELAIWFSYLAQLQTSVSG